MLINAINATKSMIISRPYIHCALQIYTIKLKENNDSKTWSPLVTHYKAEKSGLKTQYKKPVEKIMENLDLTASNEKKCIYEYYYYSTEQYYCQPKYLLTCTDLITYQKHVN